MDDSAKQASIQATYQNTLKFTPGRGVNIYAGGSCYAFPNVSSFVVDVANSLITIVTSSGVALFRNWDGIEVGTARKTDFLLGPSS